VEPLFATARHGQTRAAHHREPAEAGIDLIEARKGGIGEVLCFPRHHHVRCPTSRCRSW
jgi:hypothetical protein